MSRSVATGNQWCRPVNSHNTRFHWFAPLVSRSNLSDHQTWVRKWIGSFTTTWQQAIVTKWLNGSSSNMGYNNIRQQTTVTKWLCGADSIKKPSLQHYQTAGNHNQMAIQVKRRLKPWLRQHQTAGYCNRLAMWFTLNQGYNSIRQLANIEKWLSEDTRSGQIKSTAALSVGGGRGLMKEVCLLLSLFQN